MNEKLVIDEVSSFVGSKCFWQPVIKYMFDNCHRFEQVDHYDFDQFDIYSKFKILIEVLIDDKMSNSIGINPKTVECCLFSGVKKGNMQCFIISDLLRRTLDFTEFRKQMIIMNNDVDNECKSIMCNFKDELSSPTINKNDMALYISKLLENKIKRKTVEFINKCVETYRNLLELKPLKPLSNPVLIEPVVPETIKEVIAKGKDSSRSGNAGKILSVYTNDENNRLGVNIDSPRPINLEEEIEKRRLLYKDQQTKLRGTKEENLTFEKSALPPLRKKKQTIINYFLSE